MIFRAQDRTLNKNTKVAVELFTDLQKIYTAITRSSNGTIIIKGDEFFNNFFKDDKTIKQTIEDSMEQDYRNMRISLLEMYKNTQSNNNKKVPNKKSEVFEEVREIQTMASNALKSKEVENYDHVKEILQKLINNTPLDTAENKARVKI